MMDSIRSGRVALLTIFLVWVVSVALFLTPGVLLPDGAGYLSHLLSAWADHDLVYFDQWAQFGLVRDGVFLHKEVTRTGYLGNHWTVGSALVWFPGFLAGDSVRSTLTPSWPANGISVPYNVAVIFSSALAALAALLISFSVARRSSGVPAALLAALCGWLGTPLMWYALKNGTMAHAISSCVAAIVVWLSLRLDHARERIDLFATGLAIGFACTVRPQNAVLIVLPLLSVDGEARHELVRRSGWFALGGITGALPQLIVSWFLYGDPFGFVTGGEAKPFAAFERLWTWEPLFSWYHGLFTWTPFAAVGVIGLVLLLRSERRLAIAGLYLFFSQWIINAWLERSFWGAHSFGQRRFDALLIFFIIGAAALFRRVGSVASILIAAVTCGWTMLLFLAASQGLNLGAYLPFQQLWSEAIQRAGSLTIRPFSMVPPSLRASVGVLALLLLLAAMVLTLGLALAGRRIRWSIPVLVAGYLTAASAFLFYCGLHGGPALTRWALVASSNRALQHARGGADIRIGLLQDEAEYLRLSGREALAEETLRELQALLEKQKGQAR